MVDFAGRANENQLRCTRLGFLSGHTYDAMAQECGSAAAMRVCRYVFGTLRLVTGPGFLATMARIANILYLFSVIVGITVTVLKLEKVRAAVHRRALMSF